jgi:alpha-ketoglutarate-dependent 2,4-dichlorophenoxyacetate dioxygenase
VVVPFTTRQIGPCFAAEVEGLDLRESLSPQDVAAIHAAMDAHAVLVFHAQHLTDEQHLAFSRALGPLEDANGTSLARPTSTACRRPSPTCPIWTRTITY